MPTPTAAEIAAAAAESAALGVSSVTTGDQSAAAMKPLEQIATADAIAARELLGAANPQGGPRSPWGMLRPAQAVFGGG